jgi:hypothetical protein
MGDTRRYAERMNLLAMEPRTELSSTGYVLADPGREYLVLEPEGTGQPFTVRLESGSHDVEWFSVPTRETRKGEPLTVTGQQPAELTSPSGDGAAVAYLWRS